MLHPRRWSRGTKCQGKVAGAKQVESARHIRGLRERARWCGCGRELSERGVWRGGSGDGLGQASGRRWRARTSAPWLLIMVVLVVVVVDDKLDVQRKDEILL